MSVCDSLHQNGRELQGYLLVSKGFTRVLMNGVIHVRLRFIHTYH